MHAQLSNNSVKSAFLDAPSHLFKMSCPSVRPLVPLSVRWSICPVKSTHTRIRAVYPALILLVLVRIYLGTCNLQHLIMGWSRGLADSYGELTSYESEFNKYRGGTSDATSSSSLIVLLFTTSVDDFSPSKIAIFGGRTRPLIEMRSRI